MIYSIRILLFCLFITGCAKMNVVKISVVEDLKQIFEIKFSNLSKYQYVFDSKVLTMRDSIIEADDITWNAKVFYLGDSSLFFVEQYINTVDSINLICVNNSTIKTLYKINVGSSYSQISDKIVYDSWNKFPDGETMFYDGRDSNMVYSLDLQSNIDSNLHKLINKTITSQTKVDKIVLYNRQSW